MVLKLTLPLAQCRYRGIDVWNKRPDCAIHLVLIRMSMALAKNTTSRALLYVCVKIERVSCIVANNKCCIPVGEKIIY